MRAADAIFSKTFAETFSSVTERLIFGMERYLWPQKAQRAQNDHSFCAFCAFCGLDCIANGALEVGAVVTAESELLAVLHDDAILAMKPRLHLLDPIDLNNR